MRQTFIGAADLGATNDRLSPEERAALKKMGRDSDEDIEAYLAQRAKNREKAMRENDSSEVASTSVSAISPFPNQPDGSVSDSGYRGERMVTAGSRGGDSLTPLERKLCIEMGNSEAEYLQAKRARMSGQRGGGNSGQPSTAEFSAYQIEYGYAWSRRTGLPVERYFTELRKYHAAENNIFAGTNDSSAGADSLTPLERKLCVEMGNSEAEFLQAKRARMSGQPGGVARVLAARENRGANPRTTHGMPPSPGIFQLERDKNDARVDEARAKKLSAVEIAALAKDSTDEYLSNPNGDDAWKPVATALALGELAYEIIGEKRVVNADHTNPFPYEAAPPDEFARRHHGLTKSQVEILTRCNSKPMEFLAAKYWGEAGDRSKHPLFLGAAENSGGPNAVTAAELIGRARGYFAQYIANYRDPDGWQNLGMALGCLSAWLARHAQAMGGRTDWQNIWC